MDLRANDHSVAAGVVHGDVTVTHTHVTDPGPPPTALAQLPAPPPGFAGRAELCAEVLRQLAPDGEPVPLTLLTGLPGVGKTALAVAVAHEARDRGWFDAVLFHDLHGYDPVRSVHPLDAFLRALGVPAAHIPAEPAAQEGLYRSRLHEFTAAGRRVLVVADNAAEADHLRPLLPPPGPHRVLATSRETLVSVGARLVEVPVLAAAGSVELVTAAVRTASPADARVTASPADAAVLAGLCGHLPLALQIAAALLVLDPALPVAALNAELADVRTRLGHLDDGERAVRASFRLSYRRLGPDLAGLFELLAIQPGPDIAIEAAAVLADRTPIATRRLLAGLTRAHLLEQQPPGRWRMHDLIRAYAAERAGERGAADPRAATASARARERLAAHYTATAAAADHYVRALPGAPPAEGAEVFADREAALAWLDVERPNLVATVADAHTSGDWHTAHALSLNLQVYFELRHCLGDWVATTERGADAAGHLTRPDLYRAIASLGNAYRTQGRHDEAVARLEEALAIARELERLKDASAILHNLGLAYFLKGEFRKAADCHEGDREICALVEDRQGEAQATAALGDALRGQQKWAAAHRTLSAAIAVFREVNDPVGLANARLSLALACLDGDLPFGVGYTVRLICSALQGARETGARRSEAGAYLALASAYMGHCPRCHGASAALWAGRALDMSRELGDAAMSARAHFARGRIRAHDGDRRGARGDLQAALDSFTALGMHHEAAGARSALAHLGKPKPAHCTCTHRNGPEEATFFRTWLDALPHATLRNDPTPFQQVLFAPPPP
jgi:tetratricopeptide (TPR) repeat protein